MTSKCGLKKLQTLCYRMLQNELGAWHRDGQTDRTTLAVARSNVVRRALKNKNTVSSKSLILADFEYVILHKISQLLVYVSLLLQFVLGLATFLHRLTGLQSVVQKWAVSCHRGQRLGWWSGHACQLTVDSCSQTATTTMPPVHVASGSWSPRR